jgi:hypothetical protein
MPDSDWVLALLEEMVEGRREVVKAVAFAVGSHGRASC